MSEEEALHAAKCLSYLLEIEHSLWEGASKFFLEGRSEEGLGEFIRGSIAQLEESKGYETV